MLKREFKYNPKIGSKYPWGHTPIPPRAAACVDRGGQLHNMSRPIVHHRRVVGVQCFRMMSIPLLVSRWSDFATKLQLRQTIALVRGVKSNFPCAKFTVNVRSATRDQVKSQANAFAKGDELITGANKLHQLNELKRNLVTLFGGDHSYLLARQLGVDQELESLNQAIEEWLDFHKSRHFQELLKFNTGGDTGPPRHRSI